MKNIIIKNCAANNLKGVNLEIRFGELTIFAGLSGSGKSSLAYNGLFKGEKCQIENRPAATVYISQKTSSTAEKWKQFLSGTKNLQKNSLVITDELCTGMTEAEAKTAAKHLLKLAEKGHAVIAVEHRPEPISMADRAVVFGPGSGIAGGEIIGDMTGKEYTKRNFDQKTPRAPNKSGKRLTACWLDMKGIKDYKISFPLHKIVAVTGPMASGKSTFLSAAMTAADKSAGSGEKRKGIKSISGKEHIRRPHMVTSEPVTKNSRSTVATYYGITKFLKPEFKNKTIDELIKISNDKLLLRRAKHIQAVGLGYLNLAQSSHSLSGGECQRIKLAKIMCKKLGDRSLYIFDNPMRGLDRGGMVAIMKLFDDLVKRNNSVLIAECDPLALEYSDERIELK
ncbi:MAG: ATP-binding cassette domain-containing protein [Alphaproteobacteria bacterium]|nr:ATP-binding cassette domain-containing protein [Alphaproteobacteria bacterium]